MLCTHLALSLYKIGFGSAKSNLKTVFSFAVQVSRCIYVCGMNNMQVNTEQPKLWYAIRVTYNRELKVKAELDVMGVENFVPMQYTEVLHNGRNVRRLVPSVHNLIFVRMAEADMKEFKATTKLPVRYIMDREKKCPIVVPDAQMANFIAAAGTADEQLVYIDPAIVQMKRGTRVRVTGGIFAGLEGVFMRVKGDRRVVVSIPGLVAVATAYIHPSLIEKLE